MDKLKIKLQYLLPKLWLTQLAGWFAHKKAGSVTQFAIKMFARAYKVDMNEAKESHFQAY
ncbi:phosphatidylserine decarboxylase, partial [Proteus mirabilis]|nr:phosphatidylserine decarboxylase [Proteus mirabilis]